MITSCDLPWVEKYRATTLDEVQDQKVALRVVRGIIANGLPMNVILSGTQGTGKTTVARIIVNEVLGDVVEANVMEVNASDRVRMDFIRNELRSFIQQSSMGGGMKVVIMEEADNIPPDAQNALRRLMESSYRTCRFILTCNYLSNIIDPIRSRCMTIRFKPVSAGGIVYIIDKILKAEGIKSAVNIVTLAKELKKVTDGDMRLVINTLQACDIDNPIESIYDMLGFARPITIDSVLLFIKKGKLDKILGKLNVMNRISHRNFLKQLEERAFQECAGDLLALSKVARVFGDYDERLTLAGNQELQLIGLISRLCVIMGGAEN